MSITLDPLYSRYSSVKGSIYSADGRLLVNFSSGSALFPVALRYFFNRMFLLFHENKIFLETDESGLVQYGQSISFSCKPHNFIHQSLNSDSAQVQILLAACRKLAMGRVCNNSPGWNKAQRLLLINHPAKTIHHQLNVSFLHPLKTESQRFSDVFKRYRKRALT